MSAAFTQDKRLLRLFTPLGADALIALSAHGEDILSDGFTYTVDAFSERRHDLQASDLVGKRATLAIVQHDGSLRYLNGYVTRLTATGRSHNGQRSSYQLSLQPWLHFLDRGADCRIFQELSVPDVLKQLFAPLGVIADCRFELKRPHPPRRYLTQYNESNGNFMRRLLGLDGIGYRIEHGNDRHTVCFFDDADSLPPVQPEPVLRLQSVTTANDHLSSWVWQSEFAAGQHARSSYNYQTPARLLTGQATAPASITELARAAQLENYRDVETHIDGNGAQRQAGYAMEQAAQRQQRGFGGGTYRHLEPGLRFRVMQVPGGSWWQSDQEFLLTRTSFIADDRHGEPVFNVDIEAAPRGTLIYPKAGSVRIDSLQTATVTGPKGEEIYTDALGRIKVRFPWDRDTQRTGEKSGCWLRVMQPFAGPDFGAQFTPRISQEVTVAFENGNPDRPFVIGALYHAEHQPPYPDDHGARAGIRTRTTKGGSVSNRNELAFADIKGSEEFLMQAERDLNARIKHDDTRFVGGDLDIDIKGSKTVVIGGDDTHNIEEALSFNAGQKIIFRVGSSEIEINSGEVVMRSPKILIDGQAMPVGVTPPTIERPYRVEVTRPSESSAKLSPTTAFVGPVPVLVQPAANKLGPAILETIAKSIPRAAIFLGGMLHSPELGGPKETITGPDGTTYSKYGDETQYRAVAQNGEKWTTLSPQDDIGYRTWLANGGDGSMQDWVSQGKPGDATPSIQTKAKINPSHINELRKNGIKFTEENIIATGRNPDNKIVFLESGNTKAGLKHIVDKHAEDFKNIGVPENKIPDVVMQAATEGKMVGYQGKDNGRPIYEIFLNGKPQRIAVTTSTNGFIVGANPAGGSK